MHILLYMYVARPYPWLPQISASIILCANGGHEINPLQIVKVHWTIFLKLPLKVFAFESVLLPLVLNILIE